MLKDSYPLPFERVLTTAEFRDFWTNERLAHQWEPKTDPNNRSWFSVQDKYTQEELDAPLPYRSIVETTRRTKVGRPIMYDWSLQFLCRRHRVRKTLATGKESVGSGCPVNIQIHKLVGQDKISIVYYWKHSHEDSLRAWSLLPIGRNERIWLTMLAERGHSWQTAEAQLRPSEELMTQVKCIHGLEMPRMQKEKGTNI